jgi:hypothetical protein
LAVAYQKARVRRAEGGVARWDELMPIEITERPARGDLVCLGCPVLMSWTKAFSNQHDNEVPAYFRLMRGMEHESDCPLNFRTIMTGLRKDPDSGVTLRDKKFFLRLPDEALTPNIQKTSTTVAKRSNAPSWAQTFTSAAAISKFLLQFADADEFINQLKIDYKDSKGNPYELFWRDFCFDASDPVASLRYFEKLRAERFAGQVHPVAIQMTVVGGPSSTRNGIKQRINARTGAMTKETNGSGRRLDIAIYSKTLLGKLKDGDVILALGHCTFWNHGFESVTEIRLDLEHSWQLARLQKGPRP